jgi:signal transduction histidine kinase
MRRVLLALVVAVLACTQARAGEDQCQIPEFLTRVDGTLAGVSRAVGKDHRLRILVVGTGSSALLGPEGRQASYPARLETALTAMLPQISISVSADVKIRRNATEMAAALGKLSRDAKADLVIWQTGTVEAMRRVDPDEFRETLDKGVSAVRASGADIILMNMQYSPRTETMIAVQAYADAMHSVAQQRDAPLFDRLAAMKHWSETGAFDLAASNRNRIAEKVHDCLGKTLATLIVESAHLAPNGTKEKP